jgi:translocation and assembly module TamB
MMAIVAAIGRFVSIIARWVRRLASATLMLVLLAAAAFGLLQTPFGQEWLAGVIARAVSTPGSSIAIVGLRGIVPFDIRVARLEVADDRGTWLVLREVGAELTAADLLAGRVHFRALTAAAVEAARAPHSTSPPQPISQQLELPQLPVPVTVDRIAVERLTLAPALLGRPIAATVVGHAALGDGNGRLDLDLRQIDGVGGQIALRLGVSGRPEVLDLDLRVEAPDDAVCGARSGPMAITLRGKGPVVDWRGRLGVACGPLAPFDAALAIAADHDMVMSLDGTAEVASLLPAAMAPLIGERVPLQLRATFAADGAVSLDGLSAETAVGSLTGEARVGPGGDITARFALLLPDLARVKANPPMRLAGSARLVLSVSGQPGRPAFALNVAGDDVRAGTTAAEHVEAVATVDIGDLSDTAAPITIAAHGTFHGIVAPGFSTLPADQRAVDWSLSATSSRDLSRVDITRIAVEAAGATVSGQGTFEPATVRVAAALTVDLPRLQPLAAALGLPLAGRVAARIEADGTPDHLKLKADIDGSDLAAGTARLDRLQLVAVLPDLPTLSGTAEGSFASAGLAGTFSLAADAGNPAEWLIPHLRVTAEDTTIDGNLRIDRASGLARGSLAGRLPNLARWSHLAGIPLAGSLDFKATLERSGGQNLDLRLAGDRLALGAATERVALGHIAATASLTDLRGTPGGKAELTATGIAFGSGWFDKASLTVSGARPGHLGFTGEASGKLGVPVQFQLGGDYEGTVEAGELHLARFAATFGSDHVRLTRTLTLAKRGADISFSGLALALDGGQVTGDGGLRGSALSARLQGRNLPVASLARLAGEPGARGTLGFDISLSGTTAAPRGRFSLAARGLSLAAPGRRLPSLGIAADGSWNGRELTMKGEIAGLKGEAFAFSGSVPLVLTAAPFGLSLPAQGPVAFRLQGKGQLADIADLLPLGEDRLTGKFVLDARIDGTLVAPTASGRLGVSDGRYENFASGAVLTGLHFDLFGDRDRFTLRDFAASDGSGGTLGVQGGVRLAGPAGPSFDLTVNIKRFRIAARDEATVLASGEVAVSGSVAAPKVTGRLTVDRADCTLPDTLPPSIVRLTVVHINRPGDAGRSGLPQTPPEPAVAAALDITISMPGQVFVRGHGLDSEWRGELKVGGTTAAPKLTGTIDSLRGTFDFLGKTFRVTQGSITFAGDAEFDPRLDIHAEVAAADVTARVQVAGSASTPTVSLSSSPPLPRDEILSRVLFGRGLGQINAGEGLQVAQSAATLVGGGPGMLDKLRSSLGLDRLSLGAAPTGVASSTLNPAAAGTATSNTAVSGGKYVMPGVFVGVTQGTTPQSSKVTVEVEIRPHLSVETDISRSNGNGIGLNYKYDY